MLFQAILGELKKKKTVEIGEEGNGVCVCEGGEVGMGNQM